MKAIWKGKVLAESDQTIVVEGNHYFPPESICEVFFAKSEKNTVCPWKGMASYYDVIVDGAINPSAAWFYPDPKKNANEIKNHVAFWNGVLLSD